MKRVLSIFLALLLLVTSIPVVFTASAASGSGAEFPELVITEMDLDSINVSSGAGPYNANWAQYSWWNSTSHPSSTSGLSDTADMMRYIEIYNASDKDINLYDYKIVVDTDATATGSSVNTLDIKAGTVGSVTNPSSAILAPGKVAVLWIYNFRDVFLKSTVENFKGYYKWRYSGAENTTKAPAAPDSYNYVDMSSTLVLAVDDTAATTNAGTLLGAFASKNIYYGLAKDSVSVNENKTAWTSWVLFERYGATSGNHADQSALNYLYGLDAHADIREGRKFNEGRVTYNCNPGNLIQLQMANLPSPSNNRPAEIAISEINNISSGQYDYIELVNISGKTINVYDYCILSRYDVYGSSSNDYSLYYFDRVNYVIPGNVGNLQSYTHNATGNSGMADYINGTKEVYSNPAYAQGELAPGETAILWSYETASYSTNGKENLGYRTAADFRDYYGMTDANAKIFAMSGFTNEVGERNTTMGLSNSKCLLFGVAKLDNFTRETTAEMGGDLFAEIKKETIHFPNTTSTRSGYPISKAENTAIVYPTMINGTIGKDTNSLGTNVAYQYGTSFATGGVNKIAGFLHTIFPDKVGDTVSTVPNYKTAWAASPCELMAEQKALVDTFPIASELSHYGTQKTNVYTSGSSSVFDVRFVAKVPRTELSGYDAILFKITAVEPESGKVFFSRTFEETFVYESLTASTKSGNIVKRSAPSGYYFAAHTITGIPANIEVVFNVEVSYKAGNLTTGTVEGRYAFLNGGSSPRTSGLSIKVPDMGSRYFFVSDIHYMVTDRYGSNTDYILKRNAQKNRTNVRGFSADARMKELQRDIRAEYYYRGLDAIFVLGDLSTDDWYEGIPKWKGHTGTNRCAELYNKYLKPLGDELGIPVYVIKGNHDSYPDSEWKNFSGLDPQFAVDDGNNVILMCDVYKYGTDNDSDKDGNWANGADYTGVDFTWLEQQLEKYKNRENIFIAAHELILDANEKVTMQNLIAKYPNVVCFLDAHTHHNIAPSGNGGTVSSFYGTGRYQLNVGNYAYGGFDGEDFSANCGSTYCMGPTKITDSEGYTTVSNCWWGYQIVETSVSGSVTSYHVTTERTYTITNVGSVYIPYSKTKEIILK